MKDISPIWDTWETSQGKFVGSNKSHGRVTVDPSWYLNATSDSVGSSNRGPFHWFQKCDNSQVEIEVPNISSITVDRSLDSDAASCSISLVNQKMYDFFSATPDVSEASDQLGRPGYYWFERGKTADSKARWGQIQNEWEDILVPNALLRTYQGYGGHDLSIEDAIAGGYLTLTGVWLIDSLSAGTSGMLSIKCRDMGKLLIDQKLMPPLVPSKLYPLKFCRWKYDQVPAGFIPREAKYTSTTTSVTGEPTPVGLTYVTSSADAWYGFNASIHGHRGTDSLDNNADTFALSVGNSHPSRPFCTDYFEYGAGNNQVNEIYIHPWGGNYTCYISILEGGAWQSDNGQLIPYDYTPLIGNQPTVVDTHANIPYVLQTSVPWEAGSWITLPRAYNAERIRVTFKNHTQSPWGPWFYRCGIREVSARVQVGAGQTSQTVLDQSSLVPWCFSLAHSSANAGNGYYVLDNAGYGYAFGDARIKDKTDANGYSGNAQSICTLPDGTGYYILEKNGVVHTYGAAVHYGDMSTLNEDSLNRAIDMTVKPNGTGYVIAMEDGRIRAFGSSTSYGNVLATQAVWDHMNTPGALDALDQGKWKFLQSCDAISYTSTGNGYWAMNSQGEVFAYGDATHYGNVNPSLKANERDWTRGFAPMSNNLGYWIVMTSGKVFAFGAAAHYGDGPIGQFITADGSSNWTDVFQHLTWDIVPTTDNLGYWVLAASGVVYAFGSAPDFGGPKMGGQLRSTGDYDDYSDIIKELLLWSGWNCYKTAPPASQPPEVYGNVEDTGIYSDVCLGAEIFDKKAPIDAINQLKEIVGYLFWVDDSGGARFESPNWWRSGNIFEDGTYTPFIPEIDEKNQLTDYSLDYNATGLRSEIVIANNEPIPGNTSVITTRYIPDTANQLRGMVNPALWSNGVFTNPKEQMIMAELISLHIWFSQRVGSVSCIANPCIQINDQVRIYDRNTSESYIHYVRGINTKMDIVSGEYTMTLDTNWLGDQSSWVITADHVGSVRTQITISDTLQNFITKSNAKATDGVDYGRIIEATSKTAAAIIPNTSAGSGPTA